LFGYPDLAWMRMNHFLVVLGGPFVNVMALVPVVALISVKGPLGGAYLYVLVPGVAWAIANLTLLASSLPPYHNKVGDLPYRLPSDGLALLTTPFLSIEKRRSMHARYFMQEAEASYQDGRAGDARRWAERGLHLYPGEPTLLFLMGTYQVRLGEYRPGRDLLHSLLTRADLNPSARALILNNIAWADLMLGDGGPLGEADAFSAEAWTALPWMPALCGTRGAVLVERGELDEGIRLLRTALEKNASSYTRAVNACYLAIGEGRCGDFAAALSYLETAGKLDPNCSMLARVRAEVSRQ
jgi:tetratricopeptide (TPR) repeat protein